jgi:mannose-6-phosphate isomerase-like protein (cupin superfamily)
VKGKLRLDEEWQDKAHKATINVAKLEKNMLRPIKPQAHHAFGLWYVLEGRMGLSIRNGKAKIHPNLLTQFGTFVATNTFAMSS